MKCLNRLVGATAVIALILASRVASAAFVLVDDFESGFGGWTDVTSTTGDAIPDFAIVADPDDSGNQALQVVRTHNSWDSAAYKPLGANSILDGTTGTLFYRIRNFINPTAPRGTAGTGTVPGGDLSAGASDVAPAANSNGGGFGDLEAYATLAGTAASIGEVRVRNGGTTSAVGNYTANTWTNIWLVIDNQANAYSLYSSEGSNPAVQVGAGGYGFRNGAATNDLISFYIRSGFGQTVGGRNETGLIDDVYVDNTGVNLANPIVVPEPASWMLLAMCLTLSAAARKRNRL